MDKYFGVKDFVKKIKEQPIEVIMSGCQENAIQFGRLREKYLIY